MKIDWVARLRNKATLGGIISVIISAIYQILGSVGVVPPITESVLGQLAGYILTLLALLGVLTDPNTPGVSDTPKEE